MRLTFCRYAARGGRSGEGHRSRGGERRGPRDEADVEALIAKSVKEFGRVDAVLNLAGIGARVSYRRRHHGDYDSTLDVDLRGVLLGMK